MTAPRRRPKRTADPLGKSALFSPPTQDRHGISDEEGVRALYSPESEWQLGTVSIECSQCLTRSRVSLFDLAARLIRFSIWVPGKSHSRWFSCPACERRTWSRILWTG